MNLLMVMLDTVVPGDDESVMLVGTLPDLSGLLLLGEAGYQRITPEGYEECVADLQGRMRCALTVQFQIMDCAWHQVKVQALQGHIRNWEFRLKLRLTYPPELGCVYRSAATRSGWTEQKVLGIFRLEEL